MTLYHGSNVEVKEPRLLKVQRELDFNKGFYTTSDLEQATRWAKRTAHFLNVSIYGFHIEEVKTLDHFPKGGNKP